MPLAPGTRLGPYEILAPVGAGGMGEVYRARDSRLERDVAIKVLPEHLSQDPQALARFLRETKTLAALSHPNLLAIFDTGAENGLSYAVTELLDGETLRATITRGAPPWRKAVEIGVGLAEGLAAAHSKGITHRDLKPENIFLTVDGRVKVLDFGLARVEAGRKGADAETQTEAGMIMGSPGYMSPEQVRGTPAARPAISFHWDACSTKRSPDVARSRARPRRKPCRRSARHAGGSGGLRSADSSRLNRLISGCLEKNAETRFQAARDLAVH